MPRVRLTKDITFRVDERLLFLIEELAHRDCQPVSAAVRRIVCDYFKDQEERLKTG